MRWVPSEHRDTCGKADHTLIECEFNWRIRSPKTILKKDFDMLFEDPEVSITFNEKMQKLQEERETDKHQQLTIEEQCQSVCDVLNVDIDTPPDVSKTSHLARQTSAETKASCAERVKLGRRKDVTNGEFKQLQKRTKSSTLQDFKTWVEG